jgi:hypothetical protein
MSDLGDRLVHVVDILLALLLRQVVGLEVVDVLLVKRDVLVELVQMRLTLVFLLLLDVRVVGLHLL